MVDFGLWVMDFEILLLTGWGWLGLPTGPVIIKSIFDWTWDLESYMSIVRFIRREINQKTPYNFHVWCLVSLTYLIRLVWVYHKSSPGAFELLSGPVIMFTQRSWFISPRPCTSVTMLIRYRYPLITQTIFGCKRLCTLVCMSGLSKGC